MTTTNRPRLGTEALATLSALGNPAWILLTPSKADRRLLDLGLAQHVTGNDGGLCITPAGLRYLADALEAGKVHGAVELARQQHEAAGSP